jgi:hypothetical protein
MHYLATFSSILGLVSASRKAVTHIQPDMKLSNGGGASGTIEFSQKSSNHPLRIRVQLSGFEPYTTHGLSLIN